MAGSEIAKRSVKASTILLAGNLVSNALLLVNSFVVARLLQPTNYGEYSLSLQPSTIFILFLGVGVNTSIVRFSSYHLSRGEVEEARRKTANSILFLLILGVILSFISFLTAPFVGNVLLHMSVPVSNLRLASVVVFAQAGFQAGVSSLVGYSALKSAGFSYILQSFVKASLAPVLILVGFGALGAVFAQVVGLLVGAVFAVASIYFMKLKSPQGVLAYSKTFVKDVKEAITFGLPSEIGSNVSNFAGQNYVVIVLGILTTAKIVGFFQSASALASIITVITASLSLSLFAAFSALSGKQGNTSLGFVYVVKYLSYGVAPLIFFLMAASSSSIRLIFGRTYLPAAPLLALIALSNLSLVIGQPLFPSYFNGVGKTKFTLYAYLADAAAAFILAPVLGFYFHEIGITFALLGSNFTSGFASLYLAKKYLGTTIDYKTSILAVLVSVLCAVPTYLLSTFTTNNSSFIVILGTVVVQFVLYFGLYLLLAPALGIVKKGDIARLKAAASGIRYLSRVLLIVLNVEDSIASRAKRSVKAEQ